MVSVVIPAKDEEDAVKETVYGIIKSLGDIEHEIIIVDDGSIDNTAKNATQAGAKVISHPHNLGYGAALKTGIRSAKYDTIVITDADGTYPNSEIPTLIKEFNKNFDMVVGARQGKHYFESYFKAPLRIILKFMVEFTVGRKVPDVNSGFRVFSKKTVTSYFNHLCNTFSFTTSLTLAYMMNNLFVSYLPISYHKREGKSKVNLFRDSLRTLQYIVESTAYFNPIKIFILASSLILISSFISLILALFTKLSVFYFLGIGGILMSIQVFCLGLLAVILRQIMVKE